MISILSLGRRIGATVQSLPLEKGEARPHLGYLALLFVISGVLLLPLLGSWLFLLQSGELMEPRSVAKWLQRTKGLYGTALNNNAREIALSIYVERRPQIIILSSSRGTNFRQEYFTKPFSSVSMMMQNIEEGLQFYTLAKNLYLPRIAIIGLDYWWFSTTDDHTTRPSLDYGSSTALSWSGVLSPYQWINEGKLSVGDFVSIIFGSENRSALSNEPKLGVQAIKKSFGTRADGSWSSMSIAAGVDLDPWYPEVAGQMLRHPASVVLEHGRYAPDQVLDNAKIRLLLQLVDDFQQHGTKVILILLPVANPIVEQMEKSGRYKFIWEFRNRLSTLNIEFYDFFDPRGFGASACEFEDTYHGGEVLAARMLKTALERNQSTSLKDFINLQRVSQVVSKNAGHIIAPFGETSPSFREVDFLRIGCQRYRRSLFSQGSAVSQAALHSDHRICFEVGAACSKWFRRLYLQRVLCYEVPSETGFNIHPSAAAFRPTTYVRLSEGQIEKKISIMLEYKSECGAFPFPRSADAITALAGYRGSECGAKWRKASSCYASICEFCDRR
jgi:hypothetical protein